MLKVMKTLSTGVKAALVAAAMMVGVGATAPTAAKAEISTAAYTGGAGIVKVRYGHRHGWKRHYHKRRYYGRYYYKRHYYKRHYRPYYYKGYYGRYKKRVCFKWYYGRCVRWGWVWRYR